jgi:hypothetical protein
MFDSEGARTVIQRNLLDSIPFASTIGVSDDFAAMTADALLTALIRGHHLNGVAPRGMRWLVGMVGIPFYISISANSTSTICHWY